jgi:hypothetical protein
MVAVPEVYRHLALSSSRMLISMMLASAQALIGVAVTSSRCGLAGTIRMGELLGNVACGRRDARLVRLRYPAARAAAGRPRSWCSLGRHRFHGHVNGARAPV